MKFKAGLLTGLSLLFAASVEKRASAEVDIERARIQKLEYFTDTVSSTEVMRLDEF